jgi:alanyl-tRNA synthetase
MNSHEVRNSFLDFFRTKGHQIVPSAPVIPAQDPTLLFTNAGMNQFKDIFLGKRAPFSKRVANSQKCIRVSGKHNDLEEVGVDTYHHTFFEMLGNWSFGDYYKKEAIEWAWELVTDVWKIDKDRVYATVYEEDDEAEALWYRVTDIGSGRVYRYGKRDNFWEMGETGPCGPCSEIHYDFGVEYACGPNCTMGCTCGRFVELWNLVFIQYTRVQDGSLTELPEKHVDTGMGFERVTAILQGKRSNYDADLFSGLKEAIFGITGIPYRESDRTGVAYRVICDHIRALTFAIADGVLPSNEGRGYVLRRLLRRAARYSRNLNIHEPFLYQLVSPLIDCMGSVYPEIADRAHYISLVIKSEEEGFGKTLDRGIEIFNKIAQRSLNSGLNMVAGGDAFKLYDTYGFPLDLTQLMARELNLRVDLEQFDTEMGLQKERSYTKKAGDVLDALRTSTVKTQFTYTKEQIPTSIAALYREDSTPSAEISAGETVKIQLAGETPFYAESGGQVGDTGAIKTADGAAEATVYDTQKISDTAIFHYGTVTRGILRVNDSVIAAIDTQRRLAIKRNHTATHLLHKALRAVLGSHIKQSGSLVAPDYLRFDFNHFGKLSPDELTAIEDMVNDTIRQNYPVIPEENVLLEEAQKRGATALFGEKYADRVRIVSVGNYSIELCGGTHIESTGLIKEFRILSETSAASGIRRIIAETGEYARRRTKAERQFSAYCKEQLNADDDTLCEKFDQLVLENKILKKNLQEFKERINRDELNEKIQHVKETKTPHIITHQFTVESVEELKKFGDIIRMKLPEGVALLGADVDTRALLVCVVGDTLIREHKWDANTIVKELSYSVGGGGGGKQHMATAGLKDVHKLADAFSMFYETLKKLYGSDFVSY